MIGRVSVPAALAALVCCGLPAAASGATAPPAPSVTLSTVLTPAFSPAVTDYWTRCAPTASGQGSATAPASGPVTISVNAAKKVTVAIGSARARTGTFSTTVTMTTGRKLSWVVASTVGSKVVKTTHYVRCLPADMPVPTSVTKTGKPGSRFFLINPGLPSSVIGKTSYIELVDTNGVPVWWRTSAIGPLGPVMLDSHTVAIWGMLEMSPLGDFGLGRWFIYDLNGTLLGRVTAPGDGVDPHELVRESNGRYMTITYRPEAGTDFSTFSSFSSAIGFRAQIRELEPGGTVTWTWNASDHISVNELAPWVKEQIAQNMRVVNFRGAIDYAADVDHFSSIEPTGTAYLFSSRHLDALYLVDKATGNIKWKLGGTPTDKSLTVIGDSYEHPLGAPHDARVLPDGTITVLDDGLGWNRNPRAVRYAVDPVARTATVISTLTKSSIHGSNCCGSVRTLPNGNTVVGWGANNSFDELTPNGVSVLSMTLPVGMPTYRVQPITDSRVTANYLRSAMDKSLTAK